MGVLTYVKRMVFYGAVAAVFAIPAAYKLGYKRGVLDSNVNFIDAHNNSSRLEKITAERYSVVNPDDMKSYVVDFRENTVQPDTRDAEGKKKRLEDIFLQ